MTHKSFHHGYVDLWTDFGSFKKSLPGTSKMRPVAAKGDVSFGHHLLTHLCWRIVSSRDANWKPPIEKIPACDKPIRPPLHCHLYANVYRWQLSKCPLHRFFDVKQPLFFHLVGSPLHMNNSWLLLGHILHLCLLWFSGNPHLTAKTDFFAPLSTSTKNSCKKDTAVSFSIRAR